MQPIHPKIGGAAIAGSATVVLVWLIGLIGLAVPAEVTAALTTLVAFVVGYAIPSANANGQ